MFMDRTGVPWHFSIVLILLLVRVIATALLVENPDGATKPTVRCPVYTYFEDLTQHYHQEDPGMSRRMNNYDHNLLVRQWLRNWYANGWDPVVLGRVDAETAPLFPHYQRRFQAYPTVNNEHYELACYIRWLAFAERDGGVFVDYDIYNFPAEALPRAAGVCGRGPLLSYPDFLPMLLFGNGTETKRLILEYVRYQVDPEADRFEGRPHISDMIIARKRRERVFRDLLPNPPNLAHLSSHSKRLAGDRLESVKRLRRPEWVRQNLLLRYKHTHRILLLQPDPDGGGDMVDSGIGKDGLLGDLISECMPAVTAQEFLAEAFQMREGDAYICSFATIPQIEPLMLSKRTDTVILMLEDPLERLVRTYRRLEETLRDPPTMQELVKIEGRDMLVRQLTGKYNETVSSEAMTGLLEQAKGIIGTGSDLGQVILGIPSRILDTKLVLEYSLGFTLAPPTMPYLPPSETTDTGELTESIRKEFQSYNQYDYALYEYAKGVFEARLERFNQIDNQLNKE